MADRREMRLGSNQPRSRAAPLNEIAITGGGPYASAESWNRRTLAGWFLASIETDQASHHHRQKKLPANAFNNGKTPRHIGARDNIAVAQGSQSNKTVIDRAHAGKAPRSGKCAGALLLQSPIKKAKKNSRQ